MDLQIEEGNYKGFDGAEMFFQTWTKSSPKAVILGVHGLGEHVDSYRLLAQGLNESSYQLVMTDLRGHGKSSGRRGVATIDEFVLDLKIFQEVIKARFPGLPVFFLGHSMGGLTALKYLIRNGSVGVKGLVLSSPLLGVAVDIPKFKRKSAGFLATVAPNVTLFNEIDLSHVTHDQNHIREMQADHLRHDRISSKLFVGMLESMDYVMRCVDKIQLPVLIQQAGDDLIVKRTLVEDLYEKIQFPDKELLVYEKLYHEVYNETGREKVFKDLLRWLDSHLSK